MKRTSVLTAVLTAPLLCALLAPCAALAAGKDPYHEQTPLDLTAPTSATHSSVSGGGGSLVRTFIGLAVVVAVIYGLTWVLRQMKAAKQDRSTGFGLSTEATMPLGPGRSVHLIRAGRELVLIGSAEHGVVPLRTYTEDEARDLGLIAPLQPGSGDEGGAAVPVTRLRAALDAALELLRQKTAR